MNGPQYPTVGSAAPDFSRPATGDRTISLSDFVGKRALVVYFLSQG